MVQMTIVIVALLLIAGVQVAFSLSVSDTSYEIREKRVIWSTASFSIVNGTPYTFHQSALEEVSPGLYNITMPTFSQGAWVELNESLDSIELKIARHFEIPEKLSQNLYLRTGYEVTMGNQFFTWRFSTPLAEALIGEHVIMSSAEEDLLTMENVTGFNGTSVFIKCEIAMWAVSLEYLSDRGSVSTEQNHTILFNNFFEVTLRFRHADQRFTDSVSVLIIETIAIAGAGFSIILAIPTNRDLPE